MPEIQGEAKEDSALFVDTSRITDEDGIGQMALIWQRSSQRTNWENVPDQFESTLMLSQPDVGFSYRAVISYIAVLAPAKLLFQIHLRWWPISITPYKAKLWYVAAWLKAQN